MALSNASKEGASRIIRQWSRARWGTKYDPRAPKTAECEGLIRKALYALHYMDLSEEDRAGFEEALSRTHPLGGISLWGVVLELYKPGDGGKARMNRKRATQAERSTADDLGGRRTFLSGAGDEKADVSVPRQFSVVDGVLRETTKFSFRAEVKTTASDGYTLHHLDWLAVVQAASKSGQIPIFVMKISLKSSPFTRVAIPYALFRDLYGEAYSATGDINKKTIRVTRKVLLYGQGVGEVPHRRVYLTGRGGDIVLLDYQDFLRLVMKAEEE